MKKEIIKNLNLPDSPLFSELRELIEKTKSGIIYAANSALVVLNWKIGERIQNELLKNERADYGEQIVATLSRQLSMNYGRSFNKSSLLRMIQFYKEFPELEIVATLSRQLSWSHFVELIPLEPRIKKDFYTEMCRIERWSVRTLRQKIDGMLYERTAISKKPEEVARLEIAKLKKEDQLTPDLILKDPYLLDFLGLEDTYDEKDLESAALREIEKFVLELGSGFAFIERQKRITVGGEDFYIDLLFANRELRRLVVVELKIGKFKAADKGQMEFYLRWLDKHERKEWEEKPMGIIFCTDKNQEQVEVFELEKSGIHVAEYLTVLPPIKVLEQKLHRAIAIARAKLESSSSS